MSLQGRRYGLKLTGAIKERCKISPLKILFFTKISEKKRIPQKSTGATAPVAPVLTPALQSKK